MHQRFEVEKNCVYLGRERITIGSEIKVILFDGVRFVKEEATSSSRRKYHSRRPNQEQPYVGYVWDYDQKVGETITCSGQRPNRREGEQNALEQVVIKVKHIHTLRVRCDTEAL